MVWGVLVVMVWGVLVVMVWGVLVVMVWGAWVFGNMIRQTGSRQLLPYPLSTPLQTFKYTTQTPQPPHPPPHTHPHNPNPNPTPGPHRRAAPGRLPGDLRAHRQRERLQPVHLQDAADALAPVDVQEELLQAHGAERCAGLGGFVFVEGLFLSGKVQTAKGSVCCFVSTASKEPQ